MLQKHDNNYQISVAGAKNTYEPPAVKTPLASDWLTPLASLEVRVSVRDAPFQDSRYGKGSCSEKKNMPTFHTVSQSF